MAVVWARTEEGIRGFLVERGTPGYTTSDIHGKWSMRASVTSSLVFADCRVPECDVLPAAKGLEGRARVPDAGALRHRLGRHRRGDGLLRDGAPVHDRPQTVRRPADRSHQLVQEKLAGMITEITKAQLLALHAGRLKDAGKLEPAHVSMLKRNNVAMALECARISRDLLGANGITDEYPIMRHMCNLETVKTYEGTDHIHALVIGERVTGIPAYR